MFEKRYRERLARDLALWEQSGTVAPGTGLAVRGALGPMPKGLDLATTVAIVGGLLIAAAFLAFVAANWSAVPRLARFLLLAAGMATAYGAGAIFDRGGKSILGDLAASTGSIIFGAAIVLTGQMYHLGGDFAGGMMLWAIGAFAAALLTGSRGSLAVALVTGCIWSGMRVSDGIDSPHLPFVALWLVSAGLAVAWNSVVARHLVGAAALSWWATTGFGLVEWYGTTNPSFILCAGMALMLGAGLALAARGPNGSASFGLTLSTYAAFGFATMLAITVAGVPNTSSRNVLYWAMACAGVGVALAFVASALARALGPSFAGLSLGLGLAAIVALVERPLFEEPWVSHGLAIVSMLTLVVSGMLDDERPRVVAGWLGIAAVIAAITWAVKGSLLDRALFLALAGGVAIALAFVLARLMRGREVTG